MCDRPRMRSHTLFSWPASSFSPPAVRGSPRSRSVRLLLDGEHAARRADRAAADRPAAGARAATASSPAGGPGGTGKQLVLSPPPQAGCDGDRPPRRRARGRSLLDLLQERPRPARCGCGPPAATSAASRSTDPVRDPLPADLPLGRVTVDLDFDWGSRGVARRGRCGRPCPAGRVRLDGADLIQSGDSLVDLVRRVSGGETLVGTFVPARTTPRPGQRFELIVEREDGARSAASPGPELLEPAREQRIAPAARATRRASCACACAPAARVRRAAGQRLGFAGGREDAEPPEAIAAAPRRRRSRRAWSSSTSWTPCAPTPSATWAGRRALADLRPAGPRGGAPSATTAASRPNTLPSTKALFTGRTFVTGGDWTLEPEDGTTLAERFRAAGYRTGLFSGNVYVSPAFGTDRGFEHVAEEVLMDGRRAPAAPSASTTTPPASTPRRSPGCATLPRGERAFLYLHTIHPHNPYDPPDPFRSRFTARHPLDDRRQHRDALGRAQAASATPARPTAAPARPLRRLLRLQRRRAGPLPARRSRPGRRPRRPWSPLTSDHGEELFEHGGVLHGYTLYEEMLRIPLVLWGPGRLAARGGLGAHRHAGPARHPARSSAGSKRAEPSDGRPLLPRPRGDAGGLRPPGRGLQRRTAASTRAQTAAGRWSGRRAAAHAGGWGTASAARATPSTSSTWRRTRARRSTSPAPGRPRSRLAPPAPPRLDRANRKARRAAATEPGRSTPRRERLRALGYVNVR